MSKPKRELNPKVNVGDRVMCLHMDGEISVPPMELGTVRSVVRDPFEDDGEIINVSWDNGNNLSLLSVTDSWIKSPSEQIEEQTSSKEYEFFSKNPEIFENFDYKFLREWIDRYYGENQEDNEPFQEVLEMAEESRNKMVQGLLKYMESKNMDLDDMSRVNIQLSKLAQKIVQFYVAFS
jgi:predicted Abi (CAAX) family protease